MDYFLPNRVTSDYYGYEKIIDIHNQIEDSWDEEIIFNFVHTEWFEANLSAILGAICVQQRERSRIVKVRNINKNLEDVLCRNHFLCEFNYDGFIDSKGTVLTYQKFTQYQDIEFLEYIDKELLAKPDFPRHSKTLGKKISESIFEIFENARTHGNCKYIVTCGQYFPSRLSGKRLDITIVDLGKTIKKNVNDYLNKSLSGHEAIEWAMQYGNTTKVGNVSGGLGLDIVMAFIKLNQGKIQIISSDGFIEYSSGKLIRQLFKNAFQGTIINIEFNLSDRRSYHFKEEIPLDNIF